MGRESCAERRSVGKASLRLEALEARVLLSSGADVVPMDALPSPIGHFQFGNANVWVYDLSGPVDINASEVVVKFGASDVISSITLTGTNSMEGLGIAVSGASSVGSIKDSRKGPKGDIAFIAVNSAVKSIQINGDMSGYNINGDTFGTWTIPPDVDRDGSETDATAILTRAVPSIKVAGTVDGDVVVLGDVAGVGLKSFSAGTMHGGMVTDGSAGKIALSGSFTGAMQIGGNLSGLQIKGGNLSGMVDVQGTAGKLSVAGAKNKQTGLTTGGDMTSGARIRAGVALSGLTLSGSMVGDWGDEDLLVQVCAPTMGSISVGGEIVNARILAGTDLGTDWDLGGVGENADAFGMGTISKLSVKGDVHDSLIAAGISSEDDTTLDLQWCHDNTAFVAGSTIKSGSIGGSLTSSWEDPGAPWGVGAATLGSGKLGGTGMDLVFSNSDLLAP